MISDRIRVGTWNVEYARGVAKNARRLAVLEGRAADIWVLTETHDDLALPDPFQAAHSVLRDDSANPGRMVTIWSRLPIVERIETGDPTRTICVRLADEDGPEVVVYGTVLPWMHDGTRDPVNPERAWAKFYRVTGEQAVEWRALRNRFPDVLVVVAGDLNHNLGGRHYYGTKWGRALLREGLASADLACLTETERFAEGELEHPPIDHVCAAAPRGENLEATVEEWQGTATDGAKLSDHSGVLAEIRLGSG